MKACRCPVILSTSRTPVIMSAGSMVPPIIPRTMLFQYSSTVPPFDVDFSWNWKCPPMLFSSSSHSGLTPSRKHQGVDDVSRLALLPHELLAVEELARLRHMLP